MKIIASVNAMHCSLLDAIDELGNCNDHYVFEKFISSVPALGVR